MPERRRPDRRKHMLSMATPVKQGPRRTAAIPWAYLLLLKPAPAEPVPGPPWNDDDPAERARILKNVGSLLTELRTTAPGRVMPDTAEVRRWHAACKLPVAGYAGHFRGDPVVPELIGYEVGVGTRQLDGWPSKVGVFSRSNRRQGAGAPQLDGWPSKVGVFSPQVLEAVLELLSKVEAGAARLDAVLPPGGRPADAAQLQAVASLAAITHGEWIRIHPYANGNGRTARIWAAWVALRYGGPVFVSIKLRPDDAAYAIASASSMGRRPDFRGDHSLALTLFTDMLVQVLRP